MKKLLALLLAGVMMFGCAACGNGNAANGAGNENGTEAGNGAGNTADVEVANANEILTKVWANYGETAGEDLQFIIGGGNGATAVMDEPATFDLTAEGAVDELTAAYCMPADTVAMVDDVATMLNMMMANNFTAAAYHVTDTANVNTVVANVKDATLNNQWMCGFPEKLIIVTIGNDYVVSAFGNGQVIDAFKTAITNVYGDAAVFAVEESLQ